MTHLTPLHFRRQYSRMMTKQDEDVGLAEAALLISGEVYPELDISRYMTMLDSMAEEARQHIDSGADPKTALEGLSFYLFHQKGFRGNQRDYYNPLNSYLNAVLDRKLGIPITLSVIYIEVGQRLGMSLNGIGLPGHFVVGTLAGDDELYVDPFHGGKLLTRADCSSAVAAMFGGSLQLREDHLAPYTRKQVLVRILNNLKVNYVSQNRLVQAIATADLIALTNPTMASNYRERAWMLASLRQYGLSIRDLQQYLALVPSTPDRANIRRHIRALWHMVAPPN